MECETAGLSLALPHRRRLRKRGAEKLQIGAPPQPAGLGRKSMIEEDFETWVVVLVVYQSHGEGLGEQIRPPLHTERGWQAYKLVSREGAVYLAGMLCG